MTPKQTIYQRNRVVGRVAGTEQRFTEDPCIAHEAVQLFLGATLVFTL